MHLAFVDYKKAFDNVKRKNFNTQEQKNIPNLLLKNILEVFTNNTVRFKIKNNTTEKMVTTQPATHSRPLSSTYTFMMSCKNTKHVFL
jgi:hypothetical protein